MAKSRAKLAELEPLEGGGVESKGKTQGKMVTMKRGGKAC